MKTNRYARGLVAGLFLFVGAWTSAASPLILIPANATWKYLGDGTDQGTAWRQVGFNDSAWLTGAAELGYGDGDETTVVTTVVPRPPTIYFRREVVVPAGLSAASVRLLVDDGAVVYVNGVEVLRNNMPAGLVGFGTFAIVAAEPTNFTTSAIATAPFVAGTNVIAVEVHQVNLASSDMSFALELAGEFGPPGPSVTVEAIRPETREQSPLLEAPLIPAVFRVTRTGPTNNALGVSFVLSGTASNGVDYEFVSGALTIPAGSPDANVEIVAVDDELFEGTETVVLTLSPSPCPECYHVGNPGSAIAYILDNDGPTNNTPPTVAMFQPTNGAVFIAPVNVELRATAHDLEDGQSISVEFFDGTNRIGAGVFFPTLCPAFCPYYSLTWSNVPPGAHTLRAIAKDSAGATAISEPVNITVLSPPVTNLPVVRVFAADSSASESTPPTNTGRFTFMRTGPISNSLPIFYVLSGTASNEVDYTLGTNVVVIPAGSSNGVLIVTAIDDLEVEPVESVVVTVVRPPPTAFTPPYNVGSPSNATVLIHDNDGNTNPPPEQTIVHVVTTDPQASETGLLGAVDFGQFAIRRTGNLGSAIPVFFTMSGTASNGADYQFVSNSVVIPAGATQAIVNIAPIPDNLIEGTETVVLTLRQALCPPIFPPGPECYLLGSPTQAVVNILDGSTATNRPPVVQLNYPVDGSSFTAPTSIVLQAYAQDPEDGISVTVEFFSGTNSLGLGTFVPSLCPAPFCPYFALVWSNVPPGHHVLRALARDSAGATGVSAPVNITVTEGPPPDSFSLISTGAVWKYLDDGTDQGTAWRELNFNDGTWASGPGQLGFGDGDEATVIRRGDPNSPLSFITFYFRRAFEVVNAGSISNLAVRLLRDDGGVVYLNGVEVFRSNMPTGAVTYQTLAPMAVCCEDESTHYYDAPVDPGLLVEGVNVVAVEIHQNAVTSSDISFDLGLTAMRSPVPPPERTIVHVVATDPLATEISITPAVDPAQFAIRRSGNLGFDIPVFFTMSGTASNGVDYNFVPNSVVIPAGSTQVVVNINPVFDNIVEGSEAVVLTLGAPVCPAVDPPPPECYLLGSPTQAVATIVDGPGNTNNPPVVRVFATDNSASESNPATNTGRFTFTRTGPISNSLPVFFSLSGTASNGLDYMLGTNVVVIPPGSSNANLLLIPIDDAVVELQESVVLTVVPPPPTAFTPFYLVGLPSNATVFIEDNDSGTNTPPERTVVHVVATDPQATELGLLGAVDPGQFAIRRAGNLGSAIPVFFRVSGTASNGVDYSFVSNSVVIPAGATQAVVNIFPVADNIIEGAETVMLTLEPVGCVAVEPPPPECYLIGSPTQAVVNILDGPLGTNRPPIAQWVAPPNGSVFTQAVNILLRASAHDPDGFVTRVEFRRNGGLIGITTNAVGTNYSFMWSNAPIGVHTMTAVAMDSLNARGTSGPVQITVVARPTNSNSAPIVTITSPTNGASFIAPTNILIEAVTRDADGYADTVEFFADDQKIGESQIVFIRAPDPGDPIYFEFLWTNPPAGQHVLRARTTDNSGIQGASAPVEITVLGDGDSDDDGVPDNRDRCPRTPAGAIVNEHGCSIAQICPCEGPWHGHFEYVQCVRETSQGFLDAGLITVAQRDEIVAAAQGSDCGRRRPRLIVPHQYSEAIRTNGCRLIIEGDGPATCVVECSTDLNQWTPIRTNTLSGVTIEIIDLDACNALRRFYRMRVEE
jgi:hypothetical protein